jgi:RNA polymerase sigma-70 factor (ECF subfamily)
MKSNFTSTVPHHSTQKQSVSRETEAELIDRTLQGRIDAFADLVQPHLTPLNRFAQHKLRREAEDVVQQSILLALSHLRQFRREASFSTWLHGIAINEVFRLRRQSASHRLCEPLGVHLADSANSPYLQCEQRERADRLHKALTRLPKKYRLMIQLRDLRELSIDETAHSLSLTSASVRTRHHRARKLLVRSLATLRRDHSAQLKSSQTRRLSASDRP